MTLTRCIAISGRDRREILSSVIDFRSVPRTKHDHHYDLETVSRRGYGWNHNICNSLYSRIHSPSSSYRNQIGCSSVSDLTRLQPDWLRGHARGVTDR